MKSVVKMNKKKPLLGKKEKKDKGKMPAVSQKTKSKNLKIKIAKPKIKPIKKLTKQSKPIENIVEKEKEAIENDTKNDDSKTSDQLNSQDKNANLTDVLKSIRKNAEQAINILIEVSKRSKTKTLFPEIDQALHIQCVYKKPAASNDTNICHKEITLPHALHESGNTTVCLMIRDRDTSEKARFDPDVDKQSREWEDILREQHGITKNHVHKILTLRQFQREYHTYVEKRQLASAYDIFIVDAQIAPRVWRECGKEFYKARKMPFCVDLSKRNVLEQIKKTFSTITLPLSPHRTRTSLIIGNLSQPENDLIDNIQEALARLFDYCPGGLPNIRSAYLQIVTGGPTIPIYADLGSANEVRLPRPKKKRDKIESQETVDELSTLPDGLKVAVRADGRVRVIDEKTNENVYYPTVNDEWEEKDDLKPKIDPLKIQAKRLKKAAIKKRKAELKIAREKNKEKLSLDDKEAKESKVLKAASKILKRKVVDSDLKRRKKAKITK